VPGIGGLLRLMHQVGDVQRRQIAQKREVREEFLSEGSVLKAGLCNPVAEFWSSAGWRYRCRIGSSGLR
jgi:hypothetical protein